jgi:hypothetical protein
MKWYAAPVVTIAVLADQANAQQTAPQDKVNNGALEWIRSMTACSFANITLRTPMKLFPLRCSFPPAWPYTVDYEELGIDIDVLILGGGIAGCWTAISAARKGVRVALSESHDFLCCLNLVL